MSKLTERLGSKGNIAGWMKFFALISFISPFTAAIKFFSNIHPDQSFTNIVILASVNVGITALFGLYFAWIFYRAAKILESIKD